MITVMGRKRRQGGRRGRRGVGRAAAEEVKYVVMEEERREEKGVSACVDKDVKQNGREINNMWRKTAKEKRQNFALS